ncbi:MAG: hypothetical protein ABIH00_08780, partial [Armatimonadota bacterium]
VQPRSEKYVLVKDKVFQYDAVVRDKDKKNMISQRRANPMRVRTKEGCGDIYYTNLLTKMLCLVTNRMATFDPEGIGLEMEAGKPGWNDSMNGLPGILGSSLCETLELEKALLFLSKSCEELKSGKIKIYKELYDFIISLEKIIDERLKSKKKDKKFIYWDKSHTLKEVYREKTKFGIDGKEVIVDITRIKKFIDKCLALLKEIYLPGNRNKVFDKNGVPYTYYENKVVNYKFITDKNGKKKLAKSGYPLVKPLKFKFTPLPLFLEGAVHMMKVHPELRNKIYNGVRKSRMYDRKLKMYKVCESLKDAPFEIGRVKAWGPGWIENESVYTHMEYKYLLEIIKSGLYDEFYRDIKTMLAPCFDPKIYGRSTIENVSFIVSSAFPDKKMHGRGLQPRLSGVTGEMVNIWVLMTTGKKPFYTENGRLRFSLKPALSSSLFTKKKGQIPANCFGFKLFGDIDVIYENKKMKNTYGKNGVSVKEYILNYKNGKKVRITGNTIDEPYSYDIREGKVKSICIILS